MKNSTYVELHFEVRGTRCMNIRCVLLGHRWTMMPLFDKNNGDFYRIACPRCEIYEKEIFEYDGKGTYSKI